MSRQKRRSSDVRQETPASKTQPPGRAGRGVARALLPAIDRHQVHKRHPGLTPRVSASEFRVNVRAEPARLNSAIAWLFMLGASCFALGAIPAYVHAVGANADAMTFFVGSLFFTSASFCQLVQAQSPGTTGVDASGQNRPAPVRLIGWEPDDRGWLAAATQFPGTLFFNVSTLAALTHNTNAAESDRYVWRPDLFGSVLFLAASAFGILAVSGRFLVVERRSVAWWVAWVNMLGSVLFMASALASYVLPSTDELVSTRLSVAGTLLGAVCFLVGAALMFPLGARGSSRPPTPSRGEPHDHFPPVRRRRRSRAVRQPLRDPRGAEPHVPRRRHDGRRGLAARPSRTSPSRETRPATSPRSSRRGWNPRRNGS